MEAEIGKDGSAALRWLAEGWLLRLVELVGFCNSGNSGKYDSVLVEMIVSRRYETNIMENMRTSSILMEVGYLSFRRLQFQKTYFYPQLIYVKSPIGIW